MLDILFTFFLSSWGGGCWRFGCCDTLKIRQQWNLLFGWLVIYLLIHLCLYLRCHEFIGNGFQQLRGLSVGSHKVKLLWVEQIGTSVEPTLPFSLASSFFWSFSFIRFGELSQLLECLIHLLRSSVLLARILLLFIYCNASGMLGNLVGSPQFAMEAFGGCAFWVAPIPLMSTTAPVL